MLAQTMKVEPVGYLAKIDGAGRITLPRKIKRDLKIEPGQYWEIMRTQDALLIRRA